MGSSSSSASLGSVEPVVVSSDVKQLQCSYNARVVEYCVYTTNLGEWKAPLILFPVVGWIALACTKKWPTKKLHVFAVCKLDNGAHLVIDQRTDGMFMGIVDHANDHFDVMDRTWHGDLNGTYPLYGKRVFAKNSGATAGWLLRQIRAQQAPYHFANNNCWHTLQMVECLMGIKDKLVDPFQRNDGYIPAGWDTGRIPPSESYNCMPTKVKF